MSPLAPRLIKVDARLELRPLTEADAESLFALTDRNRVYLEEYLPWVPSIKTPADSLAFIRTCQTNWQTGTGAQFGIFFDGALAGTIGIKDIENAQGEIGYWLSEHVTGQGVMTRAAQALVDFGFGEIKLADLIIRVRPGNRRSEGVAARLGFVRDGLEPGGEQHGGRTYDLVRYRLRAGEAGR